MYSLVSRITILHITHVAARAAPCAAGDHSAGEQQDEDLLWRRHVLVPRRRFLIEQHVHAAVTNGAVPS